MIAPGAITSFWIGSGQFYNADVQEALDNYIGLTALQVGGINAFINAEGANYDTYDEFFLFPLGSSNGLTGFRGTLGVNNNDATFDIGGILFDGVDQFFDTTIIPSSGLTQASQNNLDIQCFVKDNLSSANFKHLFGTKGGDSIGLFQQPLSSRIGGINNTTLNMFVTTGTNLFLDNSLYGVNRIASTDQQLYTDGVQVRTESDLSSGLSTQPIYIGANNNEGSSATFLNAKISTFKIGAAIGFNQALHNTNVRQLLTTLGTI